MIKGSFKLLRDALSEWGRDDASSKAAALAFYTVLSLAPLFVVAIELTSVVFERAQVQREIEAQLRGLIGDAGGDVVNTLSENAIGAYAINGPFGARFGAGAWIIGLALLFFFASAVLHELRASLDSLWHVSEEREKSVLRSVLGRVLSLTMVLGIGFTLLASLILSAGLSAMTRFMSERLSVPIFLLGALDIVINTLLLTLLFALIYKFIPDVSLTWRDVLPGAAVTAVLFTVGKWVIGLLLGNSVIARAYGTSGSLVVFLLWVFFTAQILLYGAELVKLFTLRYGSHRGSTV